MIQLIRCDDRMIHGQCIVRVLGDFNIARVIGVDDFTAGNPVLRNIYQLAVPPHIQSDILTEKDAAAALPGHLDTAENVLLLVKNPQSALALFEAVEGLPKHLNIGPMSSRKDAKKVTMYAYLTPAEIDAVERMADMGVRVYFNQTTDQKTDEWDALRTAFKA